MCILHFFRCTSVQISRIETAKSKGKCICNFVRQYQISPKKCTNLQYCQQCLRLSVSLKLHQQCELYYYLAFTSLIAEKWYICCQWYLSGALICHSLIMLELGYFFHMLKGHHNIILEITCAYPLPISFYWDFLVFCFFILNIIFLLLWQVYYCSAVIHVANILSWSLPSIFYLCIFPSCKKH